MWNHAGLHVYNSSAAIQGEQRRSGIRVHSHAAADDMEQVVTGSRGGMQAAEMFAKSRMQAFSTAIEAIDMSKQPIRVGRTEHPAITTNISAARECRCGAVDGIFSTFSMS